MTNLWYHWISKFENDDWERAVLFTQTNVLEVVLSNCKEHYADVHCTWLDTVYNESYDIKGAYMVGSDFNMENLEGSIDRGELDWPDGGNAYFWGDLYDYVQYAANDWELSGKGKWEITFYASLAYLADAMMEETPPVKTGDGIASTARLDVEFAKKCLAHALVCWQGPEWENGMADNDLLTPNYIEPWPFFREDCRTFVFQMSEALADIFYLPVANEEVSFGTVKSMYR